MPVEVKGLLEDVQRYESKNGFGATITISRKIERKTKRLEFTIKDQAQANQLENLLDTDVILTIELIQNNFGLRIAQILSIDC